MSRPAGPSGGPPSFALNFVKTLLFMLVCGIVGPIFLVIYFASGADPLIGWMLWTGLGVTILDVVLAFVIAAARTRGQERTFRLQQTGRRAYAQVLTAEQTGVRVNDQPLLDLRVRIEGDDVAPFETERKMVISDLHLPLLYTGAVPVLVDPESGEWEFDWNAARPAAVVGMVAPVAPAPVGDQRPREERLAELDGLLARDLVSREEYDAARARILGEI